MSSNGDKGLRYRFCLGRIYETCSRNLKFVGIQVDVKKKSRKSHRVGNKGRIGLFRGVSPRSVCAGSVCPPYIHL